jgi:exosome complex component RRP41
MQHADILAIAGLRVDGRRDSDIRQIKMNIGLMKSADGSAYFEQGLNKVLVIVQGPQEPVRRENAVDIGTLTCKLVNAPFSGTDRKRRRTGDRKTAEMETIIKQTFQSVISLDLYPRSEISIVVHILEADGLVR